MADDIKVLFVPDGNVQARADLDIPLDSNKQFAGNPVFLSGLAKANQDVAKGLLTILGTNFLVPNYGTILNSLIKTRNLDDVSDKITASVGELLSYVANFNKDQDLSEQILEIVDIQATEEIDTIKLDVTVSTGTSETITVTVG